MLDRDDVDEELQRGFGLSIDGIEPLLRPAATPPK